MTSTIALKLIAVVSDCSVVFDGDVGHATLAALDLLASSRRPVMSFSEMNIRTIAIQLPLMNQSFVQAIRDTLQKSRSPL